jgi:predicted PurR-regulated permease PerM
MADSLNMPATPMPPAAAAMARRWDFDRVVRLVLTSAIILGFFLLVRYLASVLIPLAIALLLAYLLNPIVNALQSRLGRRGPAVFLTVFGGAIVLLALTLVLFVVGTREVLTLREILRGFVGSAPTADDIRRIPAAFDAFIADQQNPAVRGALQAARDELPNIVNQLDPATLARSTVNFLAPSLFNVLTGTLTVILGLTGIVVVLIYLIFLLLDYPRLARGWTGFLPPQYRTNIVGFVLEFESAMSRYFRGQAMIALTLGIVFIVGFSIIGLHAALLLGLTLGLLTMVPYMQALGLAPALLLGLVRSLERGESWWIGPVLVLAVFAAAQLLQDWVLTPIIMGRSVGLRPVMLILSIFVWGKLLGFLGLVLAIPLTCLGLAYYRRFVLGEQAAHAIEKRAAPG